MIGKFGWDEQQAKFYNSMITTSPIIGIFLGSLIGGKIITFGRNKILIRMELLIILVSLV